MSRFSRPRSAEVRPIVLFQAESRTSDDTQTYEKIKKVLLDSGIAEKEVKIKTANVNELKGIDLMSEGCSDRFIRKAVMARIHLPGQEVNEVWIYEKGNVRLFYKDHKFYYN